MTDYHRRVPISLRFPEPDEAWLRAYAAETGRPVRQVILSAVAEYRDARTQARPARGDAAETWLKRLRDGHPPCSPAWNALDSALDDYRLRADIGSGLDES